MLLCQDQRDGIDCMNYFFDLINDCAGYTSKYYDEIGAGKMSYNQMVTKYRKDRDSEAGIEESDLLGDKHPHCLMVLEGVHRLFRLYRSQSKNQLSVDYLDTLILRLNVSIKHSLGEQLRQYSFASSCRRAAMATGTATTSRSSSRQT